MRHLAIALMGLVLTSVLITDAHAQEEIVATICNEAGACTPIDPTIGLAILALSTFEGNINENIKASEAERSELAKALRIISGISVADIDKYGLCGGRNSEMRKLFGSLCPNNTN